MKAFATGLAALGVLVSIAAAQSPEPQGLVQEGGRWYRIESYGRYEVDPEVITVRFRDPIVDLAGFQQTLQGRPVAADRRLLELTTVRSNRLGIHDLRLPDGADVVEMLLAVRATGLVEFAEENTFGRYNDVPNDPEFGVQWSKQNTGQAGCTSDADIDADLAWDITAGDPAIVLAVLDSGTEITHEELAPSVWTNTAEIPGNGTDDDSNGYIDDVNGWDFGNNNNQVAGTFFHGTFVAGIVMARADNGIGIAGVAGGFGATPGCRTMCLGVGDSFPEGAILDDAIIYATDNGARVITLSLTVGEAQAVNDAIVYAHGQGVFIDCAAGNNGVSVSYPATHPRVTSVASTDHDDNKASSSAPGPENWIAAPGQNVRSTTLFDGYTNSSGTSFASPHIAGVAGLILSILPGTSPDGINEILKVTADDVGTPGYDEGTGWGRVNAFTAVTHAVASDCNGNGIYDWDDIQSGTSGDMNSNGVPDDCEFGDLQCLGDGSGANCPCGNVGGAGEGCAHSGGSGMVVTATGSTSIAADDLKITVSNCPTENTGLFYCGTVSLDPGNQLFDGLQCPTGDVRRFQGQLQIFGVVIDSNFVGQEGTGTYFTPGATHFYQFWTRDVAAGPSPCGSGSNFSPTLPVQYSL